jgi:HAD superfamily hydrolase (TIGR01459 family)
VNFADQDRAELVVNTGLFDDARETPADYEAMLAQFRRRNVPMICANPDLMVERGDKLVYCAGALAELYEKLGGEVIYAGKPHLPVYDIAMEIIVGIRGKPIERSRVLAIGDGLRTDMAGAEAAGLDALFIPSLLHVPDETAASADGIGALFADRQFRPIAAQFGLRW